MHQMVRYQTHRLEIETGSSYEDLRRRFESAVPRFNLDRTIEYVERKAPWSEVVADAAASAPYDFFTYAKLDLAPMMSLAGNSRRCTEYLIGNHIIAETMYRHDPLVGLYVPLRCVIYEGKSGVRFAIDQPSTTLASLGRDEITRVGADLDAKLGRLLAAVGLEAPAVLQPVTGKL